MTYLFHMHELLLNEELPQNLVCSVFLADDVKKLHTKFTLFIAKFIRNR